MGTLSSRCEQCQKALRPWNKRKEDFPGTVARAGSAMCQSCATKRGSGKRNTENIDTDEPCVPTRPLLRASTYRELRRFADEHGVADVNVLISRIADAFVKGGQR